MNEGTVKCAKCGEEKASSDFGVCKAKKNGLQSYCRTCSTKTRREYVAKRPPLDKERASQFKYRYGVTKEAFDSMWEDQDGKCCICQEDLSLELRGYAIDHNHETGQVRGLLCNKCNTGLGLFMDNPDFLNRAEGYLRERGHGSETTRSP